MLTTKGLLPDPIKPRFIPSPPLPAGQIIFYLLESSREHPLYQTKCLTAPIYPDPEQPLIDGSQ